VLTFVPKALDELKEKLQAQFLFPIDYALKDDSFALNIMEQMRYSDGLFSDLSLSDFNYVYQIAKLCTKEEFNSLKKAFAYRVTANLFYIGWVYCQINADDKRAVTLFSTTCEWMQTNKKEEYEKTIIGRVGLPWDELFIRCSDIMRIEKLSIEGFCEKYDIIANSLFCQRLHLVYISRCEREELLKYETEFAQLISIAKVEYLRPAIKNYISKIEYEEMSELVNDALSYRLSVEKNDESFGLSPNVLQAISQKRFTEVLEDYTNNNKQKVDLYSSIAGKIKTIEPLNNGFFAINFGNYIVVDCNEWANHAYAYTSQIYKQILESWVNKNYPNNYWPAMDEDDIVNAHDQILGINKASVIKLSFSTFDILYTKDLLTITRY